MGRITLIQLLSVLLLTPFANAKVCPPGDEEEIIIRSQIPGDDRSLAPVSAFLVSGDVAINLSPSLGITSITVQDSLGQTVYYTSVDASHTNMVQFTAPTAPDTYTLVIQSSSYYGAGQFVV